MCAERRSIPIGARISGRRSLPFPARRWSAFVWWPSRAVCRARTQSIEVRFSIVHERWKGGCRYGGTRRQTWIAPCKSTDIKIDSKVARRVPQIGDCTSANPNVAVENEILSFSNAYQSHQSFYIQLLLKREKHHCLFHMCAACAQVDRNSAESWKVMEYIFDSARWNTHLWKTHTISISAFSCELETVEFGI